MKTINLKPRSLILINPSEEKAPEIKLKNSNTKRKLTEKQLDALAKGRQKRTQNLKNNKNKNIIANISKKHNNLLEELPKQNKTIKNKENINTSNKHNNLLEELPKQINTIKIMPDKTTIKDINSEKYNMKTWQPNPEDEEKIKRVTDTINKAKEDIESCEKYIIENKQKLKELEKELKELKEERENLINLRDKKKINIINNKIDVVEFNIEQARKAIASSISKIEGDQFIIRHRTNYINYLLKK